MAYQPALLPHADSLSDSRAPLRSQLLKWIGNKQRFAEEIVSFFPSEFKNYIEPFLGSGAVMATLAPRVGIGSDTFAPLIEIWCALKDQPKTLEQWYCERYELWQKEGREAAYLKVRNSYNANPNGADLLFLSRSCYGGVVRFRKSDGYMSTPVGAHNPISPEAFGKRVREWSLRLRSCDFVCTDYRNAMEWASAGDLIYCDPPYVHSQSILYGAQGFKIEELLNQIELCKQRGVRVALSIDGTKRSGSHLCDLPARPGLFEREVFVHLGGSMLKRFQMQGESMQEHEVSDRLLLTY
jgi:DNA adenine methylase